MLEERDFWLEVCTLSIGGIVIFHIAVCNLGRSRIGGVNIVCPIVVCNPDTELNDALPTFVELDVRFRCATCAECGPCIATELPSESLNIQSFFTIKQYSPPGFPTLLMIPRLFPFVQVRSEHGKSSSSV